MKRNKKLTAAVILLFAVAIVAAFAIGCSKDKETPAEPSAPVTPSEPSAAGPSLVLNKYSYSPGETITVTFTAPVGYQSNAWIGIIPSHVPHGDEATNDQYDLTYQYLNGMTSGTMVFSAPGVPGSYDLRMHDTDSGGKEVSSVSFVVN
ncbi:MAG: hypothetical protein JW984_04165 [Deltaproteobacteria bacterium]|uniref:Proteinase inhibitor I42 chagasin domain-containing protein n=1 Tax=Candidatus Zymogenus saltonus TaxID=2844893 RepID=A0A9D8PNR3_9DELT|nr:hypothetical protein [Candidatus Zymogenus saltonus]